MGDDDDNEDEALWRYVTRDVKPLDSADKNPVKKKAARQAGGKAAEKNKAVTEKHIAVKSVMGRDVDNLTSRRSGSGRMAIEGRIDLHGMTREKAQMALTDYLLGCYEAGKRQVLVITGKGTRSHREDEKWWETAPLILKDAVPFWLDEKPLREIVLQYTKARQKDGGEGALYVLLRRKR